MRNTNMKKDYLLNYGINFHVSLLRILMPTRPIIIPTGRAIVGNSGARDIPQKSIWLIAGKLPAFWSSGGKEEKSKTYPL